MQEKIYNLKDYSELKPNSTISFNDEKHVTNIFSNLYYLKQHILMLQNIKEDEFLSYIDDELWKDFKSKVDIADLTLWQLNMMILDFDNIVKKEIPEDLLDEWTYSDYEVYTDKYYHRKYWNEISNPDAIEDVFNAITEIFDGFNEDYEFLLDFYDFNNQGIQFPSEEKIEEFIDVFDVAPCTAFKTKDNALVELWSI